MNDKHAYNLNLTKKELVSSGVDNNYSKYILPDTLYFVNQRKQVSNHKLQTAFSGTYEWKADSFTTVKLKVNAKDGETISDVTTVSDNLNENNVLVNSNNRNNHYDNRNQSVVTNLSYNRKFRTVGRSLILQASQNYNKTTGEEFVTSVLNIYDTSGNISTSSSIDQKKTTDAITNTYTGSGIYTEPLTKYWFVVTDYNITATLSTSDRITLAKQNAEYSLQVDSLTNNLRYDILSHKAGLALRYVKKKLNFSFGGKTSYTDMRQTQVNTSKTFNRYFFNLFPSASINYKIKSTSNFNIGYNGNTRQPGVQQIQPIQDNSNPLDIYIGNPDLKQSFQSRLNMFYNSYQPISGKSFYTSLSYSFTDNDFASYDLIDHSGRKTHKTVNVNGNNSLWAYMNYYFSLKKYHLRFGSNFNPSLSTNVNYINGLKNTNQSQRLGFGQDITYEVDKKVELTLGGDWTYNRGTSSLRPDVVTKYWVQTYSLDGSIFLPKKFILSLDFTYNIRQKTSDFSKNVNVAMLNGGLKKKFLKSEALVVGIYAYDLLNQNLGFDRNVSSNYVNEHTYTVLKNYFLFILTWNFTKGPVEQDED
jgi:hypothetical protein